MKKIISAILVLIALASFACTTDLNPSTYTWDEQGVEFTYDSSYTVHTSPETLFISSGPSLSPPPGEIMMELMIVAGETSLQENIDTYSGYQQHTEDTVTMGTNEVTVIQYISELVPDYVYTVLILETENGTISFVPGLGHEDLAEEIIETVNFL